MQSKRESRRQRLQQQTVSAEQAFELRLMLVTLQHFYQQRKTRIAYDCAYLLVQLSVSFGMYFHRDVAEQLLENLQFNLDFSEDYADGEILTTLCYQLGLTMTNVFVQQMLTNLIALLVGVSERLVKLEKNVIQALRTNPYDQTISLDDIYQQVITLRKFLAKDLISQGRVIGLPPLPYAVGCVLFWNIPVVAALNHSITTTLTNFHKAEYDLDFTFKNLSEILENFDSSAVTVSKVHVCADLDDPQHLIDKFDGFAVLNSQHYESTFFICISALKEELCFTHNGEKNYIRRNDFIQFLQNFYGDEVEHDTLIPCGNNLYCTRGIYTAKIGDFFENKYSRIKQRFVQRLVQFCETTHNLEKDLNSLNRFRKYFVNGKIHIGRDVGANSYELSATVRIPWQEANKQNGWQELLAFFEQELQGVVRYHQSRSLLIIQPLTNVQRKQLREFEQRKPDNTGSFRDIRKQQFAPGLQQIDIYYKSTRARSAKKPRAQSYASKIIAMTTIYHASPNKHTIDWHDVSSQDENVYCVEDYDSAAYYLMLDEGTFSNDQESSKTSALTALQNGVSAQHSKTSSGQTIIHLPNGIFKVRLGKKDHRLISEPLAKINDAQGKTHYLSRLILCTHKDQMQQIIRSAEVEYREVSAVNNNVSR